MKNLSAINENKDNVTKEYVDALAGVEVYIGDEQDAPATTKLLVDDEFINPSSANTQLRTMLVTVPIGTILPYSSNNIPTGFMICDGRAIDRTVYNILFNLIGTTYGAGDGSNTFNLPNLKGRVPVGFNSSETEFDTLGETGGEKTHILGTAEIPAHTHGSKSLTGKIDSVVMDDGQTISVTGIAQGVKTRDRSWSGAGGSAMYRIDLNATHEHTSVGQGQAHNNLQPYMTLYYIIKVEEATSLDENVAQLSNSYTDSTTDGYTANYINKLNTYSTTEQIVGYWIDGKPIYRRTFKGSYSNQATLMSNVGIIVKAYGQAIISGLYRTIPYMELYDNQRFMATINKNANNELKTVFMQADVSVSSSINITVEYTKTTD